MKINTKSLLQYKRINIVGSPGSGKSTLAKEMVANSNGTLVRVNRDDLRKESPHYVRGVFNKRLEREIARVRDERIGDVNCILPRYDKTVSVTSLSVNIILAYAA